MLRWVKLMIGVDLRLEWVEMLRFLALFRLSEMNDDLLLLI